MKQGHEACRENGKKRVPKQAELDEQNLYVHSRHNKETNLLGEEVYETKYVHKIQIWDELCQPSWVIRFELL